MNIIKFVVFTESNHVRVDFSTSEKGKALPCLNSRKWKMAFGYDILLFVWQDRALQEQNNMLSKKVLF